MTALGNISVVSASYFVQTVSNIVFYLVVARNLPPVEVGAITLFLSFSNIFIPLFALNLDTGFTHFISYFRIKTGKPKIPKLFIILTIIMMIISFTLISSFSYQIALVFFHSKMYTNILVLLGGFVSESIGLSFMISILQGMQSFKLAAISNILYSTLSMGTPIGMIFLRFPLELISLGFVVGAGLSLTITILFVLKNKVSSESIYKGFNKKFFIYVIPAYIGGITSSLMGTLDRVILPAFTNLTISAIYTYSITIATIVTAIASPFSFFLLPKISEAYSMKNHIGVKEYTEGSLQLFYFLALPVSLGITVLSLPILNALVGGIYAEHYMVLQIMVFSYSFFSFRPLISSILFGLKKTKIYMYSGSAALVVNLVLSITLIPLLGIYGAVISSVSAWAVSTIPRIIVLNSLLGHKVSKLPYLKIWINALIMCSAIFFFESILNSDFEGLIFLFIMGIIIYATLSIINNPFSNQVRVLINTLLDDSNPVFKKILKVFVRLALK